MVSVHQGLASGMSRPSSFPWPFPSPSPTLQGHPEGMFLHHRPRHHLPFSYCIIANPSCSERSDCSHGVKGAKAPGAWAPGGSEKSGGSVSSLPWERPHHPHPWFSQGLAVGRHVLKLWAHLGLLRSSSLSYFLFLLSSPSSGRGWQPSVRQGGCPSVARGVIRQSHRVGFFSTRAVGSSQSQTILLCFANILPSKTASNLQLCRSNTYIKPKAKSFKICNPHFGSWHNYMRKKWEDPDSLIHSGGFVLF